MCEWLNALPSRRQSLSRLQNVVFISFDDSVMNSCTRGMVSTSSIKSSRVTDENAETKTHARAARHAKELGSKPMTSLTHFTALACAATCSFTFNSNPALLSRSPIGVFFNLVCILCIAFKCPSTYEIAATRLHTPACRTSKHTLKRVKLKDSFTLKRVKLKEYFTLQRVKLKDSFRSMSSGRGSWARYEHASRVKLR